MSPYGREINDSVLSATGEFVQACKDQFDALYAESDEGGRVMCIALHPFITGQPHRIHELKDVLDYILSHQGVWATTADDIADYYLDHYYRSAVDRLGGAGTRTQMGRP
jgi:peptidoglycan/xylan/chitin deacetylase (PgdA/CDA1 family)